MIFMNKWSPKTRNYTNKCSKIKNYSVVADNYSE